MLMTVVKYLFVLNALIFATMIVYGKLFVFRKKHPSFVSDYCATMAGFLAAYVIFSLALVWLFPYPDAKLVMLAFAVSPFLLGLLATYNTEKYYTVFQVFLLLVSVAYVVF